MIVQGQKVQTIDVEINPVSFLHDLEESWMQSIGVSDSHIRAGYWTSYIIDDLRGALGVRGRLATPCEIEIQNAFSVLYEVAEGLE